MDAALNELIYIYFFKLHFLNFISKASGRHVSVISGKSEVHSILFFVVKYF